MKKKQSLILISLVGMSWALYAQTQTQNQQIPSKTSLNKTPGSLIQTNYPEQVYWGDAHVHSGWSGDAGLAGGTLTPEDAVRFARGEQVTSNTGLPAKLQRPLDWIAVTDHSDGMGVINEITAANPEMLADPIVKRWYHALKKGGAAAVEAQQEVTSLQAQLKLPSVVMQPKWMVGAWQKTVDIMEKYNDPGRFTAFIAYEWTSNGVDGNNLHRNVIFRDGADKTRDTPPLTTFMSAAPGRKGYDPESLWAWLARWTQKTGGQVLAIPHNGNLSNGQMFENKRNDGSPLTLQILQDRARWEPLVEVIQTKGQSEVHPALSSTDEYANFGVWDTTNLDSQPKKPGDIKTEYAREALKSGLQLDQQWGVNPYKFGMIAASDTHTALATGGEENNFFGKFIKTEPRADRWNGEYFSQERLDKKLSVPVRKDWTLLAAGLTGVWATSNTREAIWDALKRKEVYASSGPRIKLRFFGGFDLKKQDATKDMASIGYQKGVPMGGDMKYNPQTKSKAPTFLFAALKDPMGANLDSVQIIKGWVDQKGLSHEKIFYVAWSDTKTRKLFNHQLTPVGNTVNLENATYTNTIGATEFIGSFTDDEFDPKQKAFYYIRVVEIPTPRWTLYDKVKYQVKMDANVEMIQQERAVSSPIWYSPT